MTKTKLSVRDMCYCAIFTALLAVCAQIRLPVYVTSITLQTFAIFLALFVLGGLRGSICVGLYLLLGAVGLPVFSGFRSGIAAFSMESGGFLIGFMLTSLVYWAVTSRIKPEKWGKILTLAIAMVPCYALGIHGMFRFFSRTVTWRDYFLELAVFLVTDDIKCVLAWVISRRLRHIVK